MPPDGGVPGLAGAQAHSDAGQRARSCGLDLNRYDPPQRALAPVPGVRGSNPDRDRHRHVQLARHRVRQRSGRQVAPKHDGHVVVSR